MENKTGKTKRYITTRGNLNTFVTVNGKPVRVRFVSRNNREGFFSTSDETLQAALENDKDFGRKYSLSGETVIADDRKPADITEIKTVTTWQQAKEFLNAKPYGVSLRSLSTPEKIKKAAQSRGLSFPCLAE